MPRFLPFLFTLSLLLCAGCSTPRRHFSLGIYSAWSVTNLPALRDAGFDLVQGPARKPYLDSAHKLGLKVLAQPGTAAGPSFSATTALRAVQQFDHHPALWAWYLSDEPDLNGIPPEAVRHANRTIHRAGASRPTALVVFNGASLATYHDADILMVDRYPVGWQPLAAFFQHMRHGGTAASVGKKPFYAVIQAFDWTYYGKLLGAPEGTPLRPPTREELRSMTHGALALGASGIFYYCN